MPDRELESQCSSEQSVYQKFLERAGIRKIIDRLWDELDKMEDDDLPTNNDSNDKHKQ